ncbi:MAG: hypothetical protein SFU86_12410 [Pirellulaceae bacterium]|nr:hypothetical protein [Pirellulaceae bacterium]
MDTIPLVADEIDAGFDFLRRMNDYRHVTAACWLRAGENEERYLYAAVEGLTVANSGPAYLEVLRITQEMTDHYLDPFRVKLIEVNDPVAKAIEEIYRRFPAPIPTRFQGRVFAGMAVSEVYIYPPLPCKP